MSFEQRTGGNDQTYSRDRTAEANPQLNLVGIHDGAHRWEPETSKDNGSAEKYLPSLSLTHGGDGAQSNAAGLSSGDANMSASTSTQSAENALTQTSSNGQVTGTDMTNPAQIAGGGGSGGEGNALQNISSNLQTDLTNLTKVMQQFSQDLSSAENSLGLGSDTQQPTTTGADNTSANAGSSDSTNDGGQSYMQQLQSLMNYLKMPSGNDSSSVSQASKNSSGSDAPPQSSNSIGQASAMASDNTTPAATTSTDNTSTSTNTGAADNTSTSTNTGAVDNTSTSTNTGAADNTSTSTNTGAADNTSTSTNTGAADNTSTSTNTGAADNTSTSTNTGAADNTSTSTNTGAADNTSTSTNTGAADNTSTSTNTGAADNTSTSTNTGAADNTSTSTTAPDVATSNPSNTSENGFQIANGSLTYNGQPLDGVAVTGQYVQQVGAAQAAANIKGNFPDINVVRLATSPDGGAFSQGNSVNGGESVADINQAIQAFNADGIGVIVDNHQSDAGTADNVANTGSEASWFGQIAQNNVGNNNVMYQTLNEVTGSDGGSNVQPIVAEQQAAYDAIRATGSNNVVAFEADGGNWAGPMQSAPSTYDGDSNYAVDYHQYSTNSGTIQQFQQQLDSTVTESDGSQVPVYVGETGVTNDSSYGQTPAASDQASLSAAYTSGNGAVAWLYDGTVTGFSDPNHLTNADGSLTPYGQEVQQLTQQAS